MKLAWQRRWELLRPLYAPVGAVLFRPRVEGRVPREHGLILVANHCTMADPLWLGAIAGRPVAFMANERLFQKPLMGPLIRGLGAFPKRKFEPDPRAALRAVKHCRAGDAVGIFPEGRRSWDGTTSSLVPGLGALVRKAEVPVVAVRFLTAHMIRPQWARFARWVPIVAQVSGPMVFDRKSCDADIERQVAEHLSISPTSIGVPAGSVGIGLALGLNHLLWACPSCFTRGALKPSGVLRNRIKCLSCAAEWHVRLNLVLDPTSPDIPTLHVAEASRRLLNDLKSKMRGAQLELDFPLLSWREAGAKLSTAVSKGRIRAAPADVSLETSCGAHLHLTMQQGGNCFLQANTLVVQTHNDRVLINTSAPDRVLLQQLMECAMQG